MCVCVCVKINTRTLRYKLFPVHGVKMTTAGLGNIFDINSAAAAILCYCRQRHQSAVVVVVAEKKKKYEKISRYQPPSPFPLPPLKYSSRPSKPRPI